MFRKGKLIYKLKLILNIIHLKPGPEILDNVFRELVPIKCEFRNTLIDAKT